MNGMNNLSSHEHKAIPLKTNDATVSVDMKINTNLWLRLFKAVALSTALAATSMSTAAMTAEPEIPLLWDSRERLQKPDLSQLQRMRFLTTTDFPPFNFLDGSGRLSGFHVELARAICDELGIADRCQIQAMPWVELAPALQKGDGEAIMAGIAVTAENRQLYAFSRPYLVFPARFVTVNARALAEPLYAKIKGLKIGVVAGSAHERMLRADFGDVQVIPFGTQDEMTKALKANTIDAAFGDGMRLGFWLASADAANCCRFSGGPYIAPEFLGNGLAIAAPKGRPDLAAAFDYALQAISVKGTFGELYLRYFPVSFF
jgi:polar amino acid transport system substrate-binding protein